ncbi:MAG: DUF4446 family protein [Negativicutes bacterium]|nr:DUF4446 family protein [Negativicutes bacterium]
MTEMTQYTALITDNLPAIILSMTVLIFIALIIFISINMKLSKLNRRYEKMMQGVQGDNLEQMLMGHIGEVKQAMNRVDSLAKDCERLDRVLRTCVQKVGIVRFNAFEDTGSDLSFAIALLNAENNGVVISSLFGRNDSRTYGKPVVNGQSSYFLTAEEKQALQQAKENNPK